MARRTKEKKEVDKEKKGYLRKGLKEETVQGIIAVALFVIALFLLLAAMNKAGLVGQKTYNVFQSLMGVGYYLLPILLIALGVSFVKSFEKKIAWTHGVGALVFLLAGLGLIHIGFDERAGILGSFATRPLIALFDTTATILILIGLVIVSFLVAFDTTLNINLVTDFVNKIRGRKFEESAERREPIIASAETPKIAPTADEDIEPKVAEQKEEPKKKKAILDGEEFAPAAFKIFGTKAYTPPPLSLLENDKGKPGVGDIKANSNIIKRTLQNFGIDVEMDEVSIGPSVTRYSLKPAEGVKLARIVGLQNDLALALAAHPIRIEAPIPGKSLVGIEIPNTVKTMVGLGTLLSSGDFQESEKPLLMGIGKGISGKAHFGNLSKMPHLLIAGATGSGKSVTIHALITSLLYRNGPENMKFIMIDPKRVELTLYNGIPHLLTPVITDAKKTILSLKWAAKEMDRRYDVLQEHRVRDIESYHKTILQPALKKMKDGQKDGTENTNTPETMPYIVIIIDELADIMQTYPRELEAAIVRLAQMSRAVGIHLMLSTQRPSVNVITGLIKANIPSRIALQVASQVDSRTILDMAGAEKLLGAGDMLYMSGDMSKPQRVQSAFISESEVKNVVHYLKDSYKDEPLNEIDITGNSEKSGGSEALWNSMGDDASLEDDDELYEEAREIVMQAGKASTSYLQRKLRVGYARAARLIDMLEERGVIGAGSGAKPREVIGSTGESNSEDFEKEDPQPGL